VDLEIRKNWAGKEKHPTKLYYLNFVKRICEIGGEQCGSIPK